MLVIRGCLRACPAAAPRCRACFLSTSRSAGTARGDILPGHTSGCTPLAGASPRGAPWHCRCAGARLPAGVLAAPLQRCAACLLPPLGRLCTRLPAGGTAWAACPQGERCPRGLKSAAGQGGRGQSANNARVLSVAFLQVNCPETEPMAATPATPHQYTILRQHSTRLHAACPGIATIPASCPHLRPCVYPHHLRQPGCVLLPPVGQCRQLCDVLVCRAIWVIQFWVVQPAAAKAAAAAAGCGDACHLHGWPGS